MLVTFVACNSNIGGWRYCMMQWIEIVFSNKQTYIWLAYCMYITESECSFPLLLIFPLENILNSWVTV